MMMMIHIPVTFLYYVCNLPLSVFGDVVNINTITGISSSYQVGYSHIISCAFNAPDWRLNQVKHMYGVNYYHVPYFASHASFRYVTTELLKHFNDLDSHLSTLS
ncbi:hypothetical protein BDV27DRAFT_110678 [Aspergillus caelatus]|uniref:Uncharacterized protein n=1 Tax=Aspergillus caelatus TaxID=61420 RepID=A0A5N7A6U3_9EURO|nr:uncharacterized protein BDV27DRAFT_110678 [Aspergillus caelatus]KAE8364829.1 hypothetical protein BDV27DRAFT_110678 [Aspergillus caelatus]